MSCAGQAIDRTLQELRAARAERRRRARGASRRGSAAAHAPSRSSRPSIARAARSDCPRARHQPRPRRPRCSRSWRASTRATWTSHASSPTACSAPIERGYSARSDHTVATLAANGIRLVFEQHRTTSTPTLKSGKPGATKVAYGDVGGRRAWLWRFLEGARSAGELYGRVLVVFAAQHYVSDLVLPASATPRLGAAALAQGPRAQVLRAADQAAAARHPHPAARARSSARRGRSLAASASSPSAARRASRPPTR